jgi:hypothetical protein
MQSWNFWALNVLKTGVVAKVISTRWIWIAGNSAASLSRGYVSQHLEKP